MRYAWIERHRDEYAVSRMYCLLAVSRTGYLQWRHRPPSARAQANARLDAQVAALHAASKSSYGRPRIVRGLRAQGLHVSHERVRRSLQRQALRPVYKRPYRVTTDSNHRQPVAPNVLVRRFEGWDINRAWVSDITYLSTVEGWLYLATVMDLASRRIVGWSMSRKGNCWDTAPMESFFNTMKVERVYQLRYETRAQTRLDIVDWIEGFYNHRRLHSSIGYRTPAHVESNLMAA